MQRHSVFSVAHTVANHRLSEVGTAKQGTVTQNWSSQQIHFAKTINLETVYNELFSKSFNFFIS